MASDSEFLYRGDANVNIQPKTDPQPMGIEYEDGSGAYGQIMELAEEKIAKPTENRFPAPIIDVEEAYLQRCKTWIDDWCGILKRSHSMKEDEWEMLELAYRAKPDWLINYTPPFEEGSEEVVPAIAMAVEPVVARIRNAIFKQDPVFSVKPLVRRFSEIAPAYQDWIQFKQLHHWNLPKISTPRIVDFAKLGTMIFKTIYDREEAPITKYDYDKDSGTFTVVKKNEVRYKGSRVRGVPLQNLMIPAGYEDIQDCPIVMERVTATLGQLRTWEASGKITNVNKIAKHPRQQRDPVTDTQIDAANQDGNVQDQNPGEYDLWEVWCEYDIDGDGYDEHLCALWHEDTREFLMLRYNWYWHQRKPYDVAPYLVAPGTIYGIGLAEMVLPFQIALTRWQRMASDNAWLANTRMYIAKKNAGIEKVPKFYSGRVFHVGDPKNDFIPFQAGEIYPSTLTERQNLFGLVEKRSGVSDYLTGRESPIIGSRATATSTIALIQQGTQRVEDTLENARYAFAGAVEKATYIEMQYGTEGLEDIIFKDDDTALKIKEFFLNANEQNLNGLMQISISATSAGETKQAKQQMQLAIINLLMQYYERSLQAATSVLQVGPQLPGYAEMVQEVLTDARKMYNDLLRDYDVPDPDAYLPDLAKYLNPQGGVPTGIGGLEGGIPSGAGGPGDVSGLAAALAAAGGAQGGGIPTGVRGRGAPLIGSLAG